MTVTMNRLTETNNKKKIYISKALLFSAIGEVGKALLSCNQAANRGLVLALKDFFSLTETELENAPTNSCVTRC